jgi:hypothetical protein
VRLLILVYETFISAQELVTVIKLMLFSLSVYVYVYCVSNREHLKALCGQYVLFVNVTGSGAYSNHFLQSVKYLGKIFVGRDSSVGVAARYGLDVPVIESRWRRYFLHFYRPSLGPTQAPIQWIPGLITWVIATGTWR